MFTLSDNSMVGGMTKNDSILLSYTLPDTNFPCHHVRGGLAQLCFHAALVSLIL